MQITDFRDFGVSAAVSVLIFAIGPPAAFAAPGISIPPGLQQAGLLCLGDALRLCPDALQAKDHGMACLREKRRLLGTPCRGVYDQGVRSLKGGDIHLDLQALRHQLPKTLLTKPEAAH